MGIELVKKSGQITLQKEMLRGDDGGYYTPSVDEDGNLTWTPSLEDMPEIAGANIKGDKGDKGDTGSVEWGDLTEEQIAILKGDKGDDGYTPVKGVDYFDGEDGYTPVKGVDYFDGEDGKDGVDGKDGYTPVKGVDYFDGEDGADGKDGVNGVDVLITSQTLYVEGSINTTTKYLFRASGFSRTPAANDYFYAYVAISPTTDNTISGYRLGRFRVNSQYDDDYWYCYYTTGVKISGEDGADGVSPTVEITAIDGGNRVSITDADGSTSFDVMNGADGADGAAGADGYTPVRGTDYWTEADKAEIVAATVAALPVYEGEVV